VLVGGAWLGGWCWRGVARWLRDNGHEAYPATLTGLGERVHLASAEVTLETHVTDVVNLMQYEDLRDVVLVGHSYGGVVVTGVADRVPERISELVYLDTMPLPDGVAVIDTYPAEARGYVEKQVRELGEGWKWPMPPQDELTNFGSLQGLDDDQLRLLASRAVAQPFGTFTQPLRLKNPARAGLPKLGIACSFPMDQVRQLIASDDPLFSGLAEPEWRFAEFPTGHYPMFSRPDDLAELLLDLTSKEPVRSDARAS
jgi:pimeloyl-ACP methyl ester carboxylesterase